MPYAALALLSSRFRRTRWLEPVLYPDPQVLQRIAYAGVDVAMLPVRLANPGAGWLVDAVDLKEAWIVFRPERITYRVTPRRRRSGGWSGEHVKALREFAGWSQQELADQLGMRQQTVSEWETGKYIPRRSTGVLLEFIAERVGFRYFEDKEGKP